MALFKDASEKKKEILAEAMKLADKGEGDKALKEIENARKMDERDVVPVGINVIDGHKRYGDEWLDQDIYLLNIEELAVNINTVQELQIAERLLAKINKK